MIYIKKIIYFIITSSFTLVAFLTLALFFYAAFFFEPPSVERKIDIPSHIQSKKNPSKKIVKIKTPKIKEVIKNGIRVFAKNMILQFKEELKTVPVHFAGSIAFFCQNEIREVAEELNFRVGNFERRPIEGLVSLHTNKKA